MSLKKIDGGAVALVVTLPRSGMSEEQWVRTAKTVVNQVESTIPDMKVLVVPDEIKIESMNKFGIIEKLVEICPDVATMLARPNNE